MGFAKMFRGGTGAGVDDGFWRVSYEGCSIKIPLHRNRMWLDWDLALSIIGHDLHIKETYSAVLHSEFKPDLFVDIGANYGTHSLLFLVHGIPSMSFEPNVTCHRPFQELCSLNKVTPSLHPVALGSANGTAELHYPDGETWLGSLGDDKNRSEADNKVMTSTVEVRRLDSFIEQMVSRKVLLKVDTEGHEGAVFEGATKVLEEIRPMIIFESLSASGRKEIYAKLSRYRYRIGELPWAPGNDSWLDQEAFLASAHGDFIAVPVSDLV